MRRFRPDLGALPEAVLVRAAQRRDRSAFSELVRRRESWLRTLLTRACGDPAEADDLAQEAFLRAWSRLQALDDVQAFAGWLRTLAIRLLIDHRRIARLDIDDHTGVESRVSHDPAPDRVAAAEIDLERALALLPTKERLCILLNLGEGMSHREIAGAVGIPLGTVKSHISRGLARIRTKGGGGD